MHQTLQGFFRIPPGLLVDLAETQGPVSGDPGFFQIGEKNVCFGHCHTGVAKSVEEVKAFDVLKHISFNHTTIRLPFSFAEVIQNLRFERYRSPMIARREAFMLSESGRNFYHVLRKYLPFSVRRRLQRAYMGNWKHLPFPAWPVDFTVDVLHEVYLRLLMEANGVKRIPFIWFWPEGASNCLIITHDVETTEGRDFSSELMNLDESQGFKSSFQVVPQERYEVPVGYVDEIRGRGFEFNLHDLNHDGRLYANREEFLRRAATINAFAQKYKARGFRAGSMHRNQDWYDAFEFSYDMSVPNVAHLDPMRGGCCTVMPYFVGKIVELPVTTAQDYSVFHILNDYSIELWKRQTALIRNRNGLITVLTHPDYLIESRARKVYVSLLAHLREMADHEASWCALPGDVDVWWRKRSGMNLVRSGDGWEIVGQGKERARLAYAVLDGPRVVYEIAPVSSHENAHP